jgi:hypothetical protein
MMRSKLKCHLAGSRSLWHANLAIPSHFATKWEILKAVATAASPNISGHPVMSFTTR